MPTLTPDISKVLQSVGIGPRPVSDDEEDLYAKHNLTDDDVIRDLRALVDECTTTAQKKAVIELIMKGKKMLQPDNNVGSVSFNIIINDSQKAPDGPNPILIPREVKL